MYAFVFRRIMDFDQMIPVAVAIAETGHAIRIGVMGNQLKINNDPRLSLLPKRPNIWHLSGPLTRLKCLLFMRGVSCLVMDWAKQGQDVAKLLTDIARKESIPSVALPHGIDFVSDISYFEERLDRETFSHFDHIVTPNKIRHTVLSKAGFPKDRLYVLGSARFTSDWTERLCTVYPPKLGRADDILNIIHFDGLPVDQQAGSVPLLRQVSELPFAELAIQVKSRQADHPERTLEWLLPEFIDRNHASQLCRWADVTMFNGSSVALEALVSGCELIWLKHLDTQPRALEEYSACRVVNNDQELIELLVQLREGTAGPRPDPSEFLSEFLHGGKSDRGVIAEYTKFLTNCPTIQQ
jgi:hypothetical protein